MKTLKTNNGNEYYLPTYSETSNGLDLTVSGFLVSEIKSLAEIVKKYADDNGEVKEDNPNYQTCLKEVNELTNQECDELTFKKIKLSTIEKLELPLNAIQSIFFMIDDSTD